VFTSSIFTTIALANSGTTYPQANPKSQQTRRERDAPNTIATMHPTDANVEIPKMRKKK
jgi:hypothetical protein